MSKLWAATYEALTCPTCGYNMGRKDPNSDEKAPQCSDCLATRPLRTNTVDHLMQMFRDGGIDERQLLATLVDMARGGSEDSTAARTAVGANPHALDALAAADGGFTGTAGQTFDTPPPPPPKDGPGQPGADLAVAMADAPAAVVEGSKGKPKLVDPMKIARGEAKP